MATAGRGLAGTQNLAAIPRPALVLRPSHLDSARRVRRIVTPSFLERGAPGRFGRGLPYLPQRGTKAGPTGQNDGALDEVLEFPHIARPTPALQCAHRVRWDLVDLPAHLRRVFLGEVPGKD